MEPALQTLVDSHRRFLAFLEPRVESRAVAEDILQSAFVRAVERSEELEEQENVVAWFYRVLRNAVIDHYRQRSARDRKHEPILPESLIADTPDPSTREQVCACIHDLLRDLKPEYREALQHVDMNDGSVNELAKRSGITPNNASVRVHRARQALRREVFRACRTCAEHGCFDCRCKPEASPDAGPGGCTQ